MNPKSDFASIAALDLDAIKVKLMHEESGEGWSRAYADAIEFEYRRFLYLMKKFPNEQVAPLFDVDIFWHYHILDTMKYAIDCKAVFGHFLHHFPYVGLRGEEDLDEHHRAGEHMRTLYEQTYSEDYIRREGPASAVVSGKVAFFSPGSKGTFTMSGEKIAFSSPTAKFAFSSPTSKFAFSSPTTTLASLGIASETANVDAPERAAAMFFSVRPTLSGLV